MSRETFLLGIGALILGLLLLALLAGPTGGLPGFIKRALLGSLAIAAVKAVFGAAVGVNLLTAGVVGALGLPGFFALYLMQAVL